MTHDPMNPLCGLTPSREALRIFDRLTRRDRSARLRPLLRELRMDEHLFVEAIWDLSERYWIRLVWRKAPPADTDRAYTDIERVVTTRFGRKKFRSASGGWM